MSLNALKEESVELWESFVWLGVVLEDAIIAAPMAATLWDVDVAEASDRLEWLLNDALLLAGTEVTVNDRTWSGYRIHDLLHDIACKLLTELQASGKGSLAKAHSALLEKYRAKTQDGQWHMLPEDGYIHAHLTWHMEQAGQGEAVHELLQETLGDGRNGWYEACDELGQSALFVSDLGRAWGLAKDHYQAKPTEAIVHQCRYGLAKTSLNSMAQNIPEKLIAVFVKNGFWSPAQGLAYAQQAQQDYTKSQIVQALVPYLTPSLLPKALELTRQIQSESSRSDALSALAEKLPEALYPEALEVTRQIQDEYSRSDALQALAEKLPEALYLEALEVTRQIQSESSRSDALQTFSEHWSDDGIPQLLEASREIKEGYSRSSAFSALLPRLALSEIDTAFWQEILGALTCQNRKEFIADIPKLSSAIVALGGEEALRGVVRAMGEVCGWWP